MESGVCLVERWNQGKALLSVVERGIRETGLAVAVERLVGVYSSPGCIVKYTNGNRKQGVDPLFEAATIGCDIRTTEETTDVGYFPIEKMGSLGIMELMKERISDAYEFRTVAFLR